MWAQAVGLLTAVAVGGAGPAYAADRMVRKAPPRAVVGDRCAKIEPPRGTPTLPGGFLFGFTDATDPSNPCALDFATENDARWGRRDGSYFALARKDELSYGLARDVTLSFAIFTTYTRWNSVSVLQDTLAADGITADSVRRAEFDGLSTELFVRLLARSPGQPLAVSAAVEPRWARTDIANGTGVRADGFFAEFKLLMDMVLTERLFAAVNLNYALGVERLVAPAAAWTRGSALNVSGALSAQLYAASGQPVEAVFLGVEGRYRPGYAGLALNELAGYAVNVGPTFSVAFAGDRTLGVVWSPQVYGRATPPSQPGALDLDNFERHELRLKFGAPIFP